GSCNRKAEGARVYGVDVFDAPSRGGRAARRKLVRLACVGRGALRLGDGFRTRRRRSSATRELESRRRVGGGRFAAHPLDSSWILVHRPARPARETASRAPARVVGSSRRALGAYA